ncbi:MAG TPA: hypothetical protein VF750_08755 [Sphingomicrobium sp.]
MRPAVHNKTGGTDDVDTLVDERLARQPTCREQQVGEQDQQGAGPADDLDGDLDRAQAASLRST